MKNSCYTYFAIKGNFNPDTITELLGLIPTKQWYIGDMRKNGTYYDFALWEYGRCDEYDVYVKKQMMKTITDLIPKTKQLREIKQKFDINYTLEIVPSIYAG